MEEEKQKTELPDWLKRLFNNQEQINKKLDRLLKHEACLGEDTLLDNQDLCLMLKLTNRSLQRLRSLHKLPYLLINGKVYYRTSEIKNFIDDEISMQSEKLDKKEQDKRRRNNRVLNEKKQ